MIPTEFWIFGATLLGVALLHRRALLVALTGLAAITAYKVVFGGRVHIGFLAAIVAASNAGGAGSVVGDTTTTMMWLAGVPPLQVLHAYVAGVVAFAVFAIPAARQQQVYSPIQRDPDADIQVDGARLIIVLLVLAGAVAANVYASHLPEERSGTFPYTGATVI